MDNDHTDTSKILEQYYHMIPPVFGDDAVTIVYVISEGFSKFFAPALQSLIDNSTPGRKYDIVIMHSNVGEQNIARLTEMAPENFSVRFFNVNDAVNALFKDMLKVRSYWNVSTYYRCFIPIMMHDYRKVLYLDSDMIFLDVDSVFDADFEGK